VRMGGQEGRYAEDVVVMAVSTEDNVLLLAVGIKALVVVGRERVGLQVLADRGERGTLRAGSVAPSIRDEEMIWIYLDVYMRTLTIAVVFNYEKRK
jgi:hypothetical protein